MEFADYVLDKARGINDKSTKDNIIGYAKNLEKQYPSQQEFYNDIMERDYRIVVDQFLKKNNLSTSAYNRRKYYYAVRKVLDFICEVQE